MAGENGLRAGSGPLDDSSIKWDHPSRLIAQFVIESRSTAEQIRAVLADAVAHRRYWSARGINSLGDLRLEGEVGLSSFDLIATPFLMPHVRTRAPKLSIYGDIRPTESGSRIEVTVVCNPWLSRPSRAQYAADVRSALTDIVASPAATPSRDIRER